MLNQLVIEGNLAADPELRVLPGGTSVASLRLACTSQYFDRQSNEFKDRPTVWLAVSVWRNHGENVSQSLRKGDRVVAIGELRQRDFETREGEKRTVLELDATSVTPSLAFATAEVTKSKGAGRANNAGADSNQVSPAQSRGQSQGSQASAGVDEPPF